MWLLNKLFGGAKRAAQRAVGMPHATELSIRCAWCGGPIHVGEPVTLYVPSSDKAMLDRCWGQKEFEFVADEELGYPIPKHAVVYNRKPLQLVGCLRTNCADTGGDRAGFWVVGEDGKGRVRRVMSSYEQIVNNGGGAVIFDDVGDPRTAMDLLATHISIPTTRKVS